MRLPIDLMMSIKTTTTYSKPNHHTFVQKLKRELDNNFRIVDLNLNKSDIQQKNNYDKKVYETKFQKGNCILMQNKGASKLDPKFEGPYLIKEARHPNYLIQRLDTPNKGKYVHHNLLYPCYRPNTEPYPPKQDSEYANENVILDFPPTLRRSSRVRKKRKMFGDPITDF